MPSVLILSYHFYPSSQIGARRVSELARWLHQEGWEVEVIAAEEDHPVPELAARVSALRVHRIAPPPKLYPRLKAWWLKRRSPVASSAAPDAETAARVSWRRRLARQYHALEWLLDDSKLWSTLALWRACTLGRRFDHLISSGPPMSVHCAARVVAGISGATWTMDLRDPWVDNQAWSEHVRSALRDAIERRLERACLRRADRVVTASPGIAELLRKRMGEYAARVEVILNGYDGEPSPMATAGAGGRLNLLYAGSIYFNRNPFPLLEALRDLVQSPGVDRGRVRFTMVGECRAWNGRDIGAWVEQNALGDCVKVLPAVSPAEVRRMIADSDVLVNLAQGQPHQIPAKVYEYVASGREMLLIAEPDSDVAHVTRAAGAGRIVAPDDAAGLREALRSLYEFYVERAAPYAGDPLAIARYSRTHQNRLFLRLLERMAG